MTIKQKQELIAEVVTLLQTKLEADTAQATPVQNVPQKVEMLTIKVSSMTSIFLLMTGAGFEDSKE
jgi:hypothetical protein